MIEFSGLPEANTDSWFVIYTKPRHEKKVASQLKSLTIESYLPTIKHVSNWHDRKKLIDMPLFPSYVFVRLKDKQSYFKSLEAQGALYFIRMGKEISRVSDRIIQKIKLIQQYCSEVEVTSDFIQKGTSLLIKKGPFTGFTCEVIQYKSAKKLLVRLDLLNRNVLVNLQADHCMPGRTPLS